MSTNPTNENRKKGKPSVKKWIFIIVGLAIIAAVIIIIAILGSGKIDDDCMKVIEDAMADIAGQFKN